MTVGKAGNGLSVAQKAALCVWLEEHFCLSLVKIGAYVAARLDLEYSHSGSVSLLVRISFKNRKPTALPRVADVAKQAEFIAMYENMLNSLADDEAVYFPQTGLKSPASSQAHKAPSCACFIRD